MKKKPFSISFLFLAFSLLLIGCSPAINPTVKSGDLIELPATASPTTPIIPTERPTIEPSPTPATTPEPLPCMIAFDSDRDGNREIYLMGPDGKDPINLSNHPAEDWDPAWSPDGSRIAFVSNREEEDGVIQSIYVMNADGRNVRRLSTIHYADFPDWSHDGARITFSGNDDIYVVDAEGSDEAVNLTSSPEKDFGSAWSPDGARIAWLSGHDGNWNIFVMDADGGNIKQITDNGRVSNFAWSVDGRIFTNWDNPEAGCFNCLMDADGSNVVDAGGKGELQRFLPFWTMEGYRVECISGSFKGSDDEIYLVGEVFPDTFLNLTNHPGQDRNPDWPANCAPETETPAAGSEKPDEPAEIVIGYAGDDQWQQQRKVNFQKACDELGIRCVYGEIRTLIEQGVDAIVQNSNHISAPGLHQDILDARDQEIPVFLLDAEIITDGAYSITIDHQKRVGVSIDWMFKEMGGKGDFAYFEFQPDNRDGAVIEGLLEDNPGIRVVANKVEDYDFREHKSFVGDLMNDFPDLKAIWANNSLSTIVLGMADTGLPAEKWPLLTCEATKEGLFIWKDRLNDYPGMRCMAVGNPPGIAYDAVYAAYYLVNGAQIDESVLGGPYGHSLYVDMPVVTNENLQEWLKRVEFEDARYNLDEWMEPEVIKEKWFLE